MRAAVLFLLAAWAVAGEEHTAEMGWRDGKWGEPASRSITLLKEKPAGLRVPVETEGALFGSAIVGDGARLCVAVTDKMLWIDRNLDGDLTKDRPRTWLGDEKRRFCGIHLRLPFKGQAAPAGISVLVTYRSDAISDRVMITPRTLRRGFVEIGRRLREVWIVDGNANLRFDDPREDRVYLDMDGNARIAAGRGSHEAVRVGRPFRLDGATYAAEVADPSGGRVVFRRSREPARPLQRPWTPLEPKKGGVAAPGKGDIASLERQIEKHSKDNVLLRRWTIKRLGEHGSPRALRILTHIYKLDKSAAVRAAAVEAMGYVNYKENAETVARIAVSRDAPEVRMAAIRALHGMGRAKELEAACTAVVLRTKEEPLNALAAEYLAYTGTETARVALLRASREVPRLRLRYAPYYFGSRYFRTPPDVATMLAAASAAEPRLRYHGIKDLYHFGRPGARDAALDAARRPIRDTKLGLVVTEVLGAAGDEEALRALLPIADRAGLTTQSHLVDVLRLVRDPGGLKVMVRAVTSRQDSIRLLMAYVLERIVTPKTTAALIAQVRRERVTAIQVRLLRALAAHDAPEAGPAIVDFAFRHRDNPELRRPIQRALTGIGTDNEAVRKYFLGKLTSKHWEDRVRAIDLLARTRDRSLVPAIAANLGHEQWQVRVAAAEAFRIVRVKEAIEPLIARLADEDHPRVVRAIVWTLTRLTGQKLLDDAGLWRRWWADNNATFVIPKRKKKPAPDAKPKETKSVAQFYGLPVESDRIVFVIDRSGSMEAGSEHKSNFQVAIDEVLGVVKRLDKSARVNVIFFESIVDPWRPKLTKLTKKNRDALDGFLRMQGPEGATNLFDAVEMALKMKGVDTICLLSDGEPNTGRVTGGRAIVEEVRELNELKRVTMHCVSVGRDSLLLRILARNNGGLYTQR